MNWGLSRTFEIRTAAWGCGWVVCRVTRWLGIEIRCQGLRKFGWHYQAKAHKILLEKGNP